MSDLPPTRGLMERLEAGPVICAYSADMSKHFAFGTDPSLHRENQEYSGVL